MAITNNGTQNKLQTSRLPSGYTAPTITTFSDWESKRTLNLTVLKATVESATASTTMDNIFDNGTIGLDKQIIDIVAADYISSQTVTTYAVMTTLGTTLDDKGATDAYLTNAAESYTCTVVLYVKTA